jgi:hypothetical protein
MASYDGVEFPEPEARLTNFELLRILAGHPMAVQATDGQAITVRLSTMDELLESVRTDRERLAGPRPPMMPAGLARQLTTPLPTREKEAMTSKWDRMESTLDRSIKPMIGSLDSGQVTIALMAGLAMVRSWVTELRATDQWEQFRSRLRAADDVLGSAPDAGSFTQFGLWDGVRFARDEAARIDGEDPHA